LFQQARSSATSGMASRLGSGSLLGGSSLSSRGTYQGFSGVPAGGSTALARSYGDWLSGNWAVGGAPSLSSRGNIPNVRSFANPNVVAKHNTGSVSATEPAGAEAPEGGAASDREIADKKAVVPLETLVASQLSSRWKMHLEQGWAAFRAANYQAACREFSLADGYGSTSPAERAEARVALMYALVALQQFTEAGGVLEWLLENHQRGTLGAHRSFAGLVPDLPSRYARRSELDSHLDALRIHTASCEAALRTAANSSDARDDVPRLNKALIESKALLLMVEYAIPEARSRALYDVAGLVNAPSPWNSLGQFLRGAPEGGNASLEAAAPAARPAVEFPFNLFQETPPQVLDGP